MDGVAYKELQEVLKIRNGRDYKSFGTGHIPVYGSGGIIAYVDRYAYDKPSVLIPRKGSIDKLYYVDTPFWNVDTIFYTEIDTTKAIPRYVYHCLLKAHLEQYNTAGGVPSLTQKVLNKIQIPLPPLAMQEEIVQILDEYSEKNEALIQELYAEIDFRKKQYAYYRDRLLDFGSVHGGGTHEVEWRTLRELFDIRNGYTPAKSKEEYWKNGAVPWFRMEDIRENGRILSQALQKVTLQAVKNKPFSANSIIISTSATIGEHAFITVDFMCNQRFTCLTLKKEYTNKLDMLFLFYYCFKLDEYCRNHLKKGNFSSVDMTKFGNFQIPVLPLEEQKRIVKKL
ncbi:MAG: restriction endonuclease subunit S, partial [Oscillospiraceae bacterium]|nr:restriction endonuclease subunit S [Oscillospiraceae bacterium]